ncbi:MAG: sn-glycerol-1-phosphate dehydrogenase [Acidobacteriota bacterium]|nr:sn-glycerol-1-phosphate dehydrogenase [Acidobacteriota bacterium]
MNPVSSIPAEVAEILSDRVLGRELACTCGREHHILTREVVIEPGIGDRMFEILPSLVPGERALLVADRRTWEVAGADVAAALEASYVVDRCLLEDGPDGHIHASVELAIELEAAHDDTYDFYIAVGSGTVNDLTKELAHRRSRPYVVVATAASMNGYTSAIVALLDDGLKTTRQATPPVAVFADPNILISAPRELTLAGLGDLVSKPYCGCDWKIASLVKGEYYCPMPDRLLSGPFQRALDVFPGLATNDPRAVTLLFELLLISGLAMAVTGTSSPASGGEHLLSHFWDMTRLRDGLPTNLHGAQVGVGSMVIDELYSRILNVDFCEVEFIPNPASEAAERDMRAAFGDLTDAVWPQYRAKLEARSARDLERLCRYQEEIKDEIRHTLTIGRGVWHALTAAGAPVRAQELGVSGTELEAALRHGREIRTRFTALDVAAELGILEAFARELGGSS